MTKYLIALLVVAVFAVAGLTFYMQSENTANLVLAPRCFNYANDFARVAENTLLRVYNEKGYSTQEAILYDYCIGAEAPGIATYFIQNAPLKNYHRFEWYTGDVYGYLGGPEPVLGNIQYYICQDGRAKVIISGIQVCSTM
ncbi:MAG: hypothetical protein QW666_03015 [Candidatus Woesearchaeota archaeon]